MSAGASVIFWVGVSGVGPFTYQWRFNGTNLPDYPNLITTLAGNGTAGYSGDGGSATNAALNGPFGVAADGAGNIFTADAFNNRVRKVGPDGVMTTVAGTGTAGLFW